MNVVWGRAPARRALVGLSVSYSHANYKTHPRSRKSGLHFTENGESFDHEWVTSEPNWLRSRHQLVRARFLVQQRLISDALRPDRVGGDRARQFYNYLLLLC